MKFLGRFLLFVMMVVLLTTVINGLNPNAKYVLSARQNSSQSINLTTVAEQLQRYSHLKAVRVRVNPQNYSDSIVVSSLEESDATALRSFSYLFTEELAKYSNEYLKNTGLRDVYLVKDLQIIKNGKSYDVAGATDYSTHSIFIDITTNQINIGNDVIYTIADCDPTQFARGIFHHELWHINEFNNPDVAESSHEREYSGKGLLNSADRCLDYEADFVSSYAATSAVEDRAEQFRATMTAKNQ